MEAKEQTNGQVKNNGQLKAEGQEPKKPQAPAFANNNPVNKESVKDKQNTEKTQSDKADDKPQIKAEKSIGLNLESTLKLVEELFRRKTQRDRLLETITNLEAFEVDQKTDPDQLDANHFQGCVLTIEDDARRKFTTKNPVIIFEVAQFVNAMCIKKLAEIEAEITIPV